VNDQFQCEFQITERELRLYELARQYGQRCEAFDLLVCGGMSPAGTAIPVTRHQRSVVAFNARQVKAELFAGTDFTREEISRALRDL
jgi:hypothetical protein